MARRNSLVSDEHFRRAHSQPGYFGYVVADAALLVALG